MSSIEAMRLFVKILEVCILFSKCVNFFVEPMLLLTSLFKLWFQEEDPAWLSKVQDPEPEMKVICCHAVCYMVLLGLHQMLVTVNITWRAE